MQLKQHHYFITHEFDGQTGFFDVLLFGIKGNNTYIKF